MLKLTGNDRIQYHHRIRAICRRANRTKLKFIPGESCLLYTSDAADERSSVDLGGRRIIKKKKKKEIGRRRQLQQRKIK